ncbi:FHA domain-containing protein [Undibacterium sp. RuRC25W]|uniref:FHA domain-containing protein n=1 Tax=Undibacterium sp. RuRC25W TaxID=3413047 RepID=UPI003BF301BE
MAKIIVTFNGLVQQEVSITKSRMTVGRRPGNDIVIDHLTVSGQHAAIDTTPNGSFVLDLGSTNGTMVNSQPIKKHLLQHDDVIDIGKYKLRFQVEKNAQVQPISGAVVDNVMSAPAKIRVMNGNNAGKELILTKPITTIGSPGVQVVAIAKHQTNYSITPVEGTTKPKINEREIVAKTILEHGDIIDLMSTKMQFLAGNG